VPKIYPYESGRETGTAEDPKGESLMEGILAAAARLTGAKEEDRSDRLLIEEIESVSRSIDIASSRFNNQSDPDLVEASIYEMKALAARYRYLTRQAKKEGLTQNMLHCLKHLD